MEPEDQWLFTSEELTRIYREEAAAAATTGERLKVLLAPYGTAQVGGPAWRGR